MVVFLTWIISAIAAGAIANSKNRSTIGWGFLGLIFGIFAVIAALIVPSKR